MSFYDDFVRIPHKGSEIFVSLSKPCKYSALAVKNIQASLILFRSLIRIFAIIKILNHRIYMNIGDKVPERLGLNEKGEEVLLSNYRGKKVVLYFYPKDNTSGCTAEACSLRDNYSALRNQGYEVIGVSVDSAASHQKFIDKHQLPFTLIADTEHELVEAMGVWGEKSMYGRKYMGTFRTTFIIDENGVVEQIYLPKEIKTSTHGEQLLAKK